MSLWESMTAGGPPSGGLLGRDCTVRLADLERASLFGHRLEELRGRAVLLAPRDQLIGALALIELDGTARRVVLCPPDLSPEHAPGVAELSGAEAWVRDRVGLNADPRVPAVFTVQGAIPSDRAPDRRSTERTEWILLTSGTTGTPKLVLHTFESLTSAMAMQPRPASSSGGSVVWGTFYDIRRYGGLQIFLRAMLGGASLVLSTPAEPVADYLARLGAAGVTHVSGTPSHWRRALMSGAASKIAPKYVRLSGEIADQAILDSLRAAYRDARVAHAFASTEAGVAFEVTDGLAGFPASLVGETGRRVEIEVVRETLRIRSPGNAARYLGQHAPPLKEADGFVDTGDRLELREGRYHFVGRSGGVVNVGGLKVYPEEVEAVINTHPWVRMSLVKPRRSPIMGAVVAADVVLADRPLADPAGEDRTQAPALHERPSEDILREQIIEVCRRCLAPHKVPAMVRFVAALDVSASGKLVRAGA